MRYYMYEHNLVGGTSAEHHPRAAARFAPSLVEGLTSPLDFSM